MVGEKRDLWGLRKMNPFRFGCRGVGPGLADVSGSPEGEGVRYLEDPVG
jgi:hypothetical protein